MDYFCCEIYIKEGERWIAKTDQNSLDTWHARLFAFINHKVVGFIWNREPLLLYVNMNSKVPCISGRMIHGDAIDDEWLAVWLLREATIRFPELVVSVRDSDGEFLLAEAAMHIPQWITPENSMNRVFMHWGQLHIVPLAIASTNKVADTGAIGLEKALDAVADTNTLTIASAAVGLAAFARLEGYPEKLRQSMHRARCRLPIAVAQALAEQPMLIAAASELFYTRDPIQMKACQRMEHFPPEPSTDALVLFNRVQYAKLVSQNIRAPTVFELPPAESAEFKARALGMKVACGFEILAHESNQLGAPAATADTDNANQ
ncbi:hypothetical protein H4R24_000141 [Coemansia sp. RSA 988]|nr:hypothetical protein H4R24_000141 [Coemansia sp. RSA 988]